MEFLRQRAFFRDRTDAGHQLTRALSAVPADAMVLGVPRGGVVVAHEVAKVRRAPLDVILAHKLGAPGNPELAIGGIGPDGKAVLDERVIAAIGGVSPAHVDAESARQAGEIARRLERFRRGRGPLLVHGRHVIVVDDGIATGSTVAAAALWLGANGPTSVTIAVPVAPPEAVRRLSTVCDRVVVLLEPHDFVAVGQWYAHFDEVTDEQVVALLADAA